ncbi:MAG: carbohydrate ABC transporter permease [Carbonactinosporaceae bacterium]
MTSTTPARTPGAPTRAPGVPGAPEPPAPQRRRATRADSRLAFWLILPTVILLGAVVGYPIVQAVWMSFFSDSLTGAREFVAFDNYATALFGVDAAEFWAATRFTVFLTVVTVGLEVAIGMAMALIMHRAFRGRGLVRTSVLVPWAVPTAVTAVLWAWMFQPDGVVNFIIDQHIIWTGSEWPAKFAIVIADVWKTAPFVALLLLAGLQIIPEELYDSAKVDGAGAWQRFTTVTLPLVKPALLVAVLFRMLDVLRIYDVPAILTRGANDTTTLSILVFQAAIEQTKFAYGSALSTLTFLIIFIFAFLFVKLLGTNVVQTQQREVK